MKANVDARAAAYIPDKIKEITIMNTNITNILIIADILG